MRELLESVAAGELSVAQAEAALAGYATGDAGRFDAARGRRTGIPEVILAAGKTPKETASMVAIAVETTDRAIVTRADAPTATRIEEHLTEHHPDATIDHTERAATVVVHGPSFDPLSLDADVGIVTAGTSDAGPAGEAATIVSEMGARVARIDDVGVAGITRLIDRLDACRTQDALIVAAGREGALPTVLAGLVDVPLIGLPVSNGYGHGGNGRAALSGMLQSCTPITVVNIDAGFTAGAQAGLIARALDAARCD